MRKRISRVSRVMRRINFLINKEYHLSDTARIILAILFTLLGIVMVVVMGIVVPKPIEDIGIIMLIASLGTVPIVIGIMIYLSDVFDNIRGI